MVNDKNVSTTVEKLAVIKNRKVQLGLTALLMLIVVIFLCSFIPFTVSKERLTSPEFITDLTLTIAITILAMVGTVFIGQAGNAQNPQSKIAKATAEFLRKKKEVEERGVTVFKQWVVAVMQVQDTETIKNRILDSVGIEDKNVMKLTIAQIKSLTTPQKFGQTDQDFFEALTKEQIKTIVQIKEKGVKVDFVPPEYYLSVKGITDKKTRSERANNEGKKKASVLVGSVLSKSLVTIAFAIVAALFVKDTASGDYTGVEIATKLFSRLTAFFTSAFMGYLVGCQINDIDAEYIEMRTSAHIDFLEDKSFIGKSIKEKAKESYIERVKEEQVLLEYREK